MNSWFLALSLWVGASFCQAASVDEEYLALCKNGSLSMPAQSSVDLSYEEAKRLVKSNEYVGDGVRTAGVEFSLAHLAFDGKLNISKDEFLKKLDFAIRGGDLRALVLRGAYILNARVEKDLSLLESMRCASEIGDNFANAVLGNYLLFVKKENQGEGLKFLIKSAEGGEPLSMVQLARLLRNGNVVKKDLKKSYLLLTEAAKLNYPPAMNELGVVYEEGLSVTKDYSQALKWYESSAMQNSRLGRLNAARLLILMNRIDEAKRLLFPLEGDPDAIGLQKVIERKKSQRN